MKNIFLAAVFIFLLASCGSHDEPVRPLVPITPHVQLGSPGVLDSQYSWSPADGLDNPNIAQPMASPSKTTLYTVKVTNKCGSVSASTYVHVYKKDANGKLTEVK